MASSAPWPRRSSLCPRPGAAAGNQVAVVAHGLLDLDLGDLAIAGWRKQRQLAAAAERTAANPGSSEVVELATHRVSSPHHPFVELLVNDAHVATVTFDLDIEFVIKALVVTVRDGHVVSLHTGACDVAATLAAEGIQLANRRPISSCRWSSAGRCCSGSGGGPTPLPYGAKSPRQPYRRRTDGGDCRSARLGIGSAAGADRACRQTRCGSVLQADSLR